MGQLLALPQNDGQPPMSQEPAHWGYTVLRSKDKLFMVQIFTDLSTGRPDVGLLQIQGSWATVTRAVCKKQDVIKALLDPKCNVKVAGYLYKNGGLGHWRATSGK